MRRLRHRDKGTIELLNTDLRDTFAFDERQGRPHTLVCIKTRTTWERQLEQCREDRTAGMHCLAASAGAVPGSDATAGALRTAMRESQGLYR